jgi:hypothetical protein
MLNQFKNIDIGVNLANAKLISYQYFFYENNNSYKGKVLDRLTIILEIENRKIIEFVFYELASFMDKGGDIIMDFCLSPSPNDFFKDTLKGLYIEIPDDYPEKHYIFLDHTQQSCLEIISPYFEFNIKDSNHII